MLDVGGPIEWSSLYLWFLDVSNEIDERQLRFHYIYRYCLRVVSTLNLAPRLGAAAESSVNLLISPSCK